ncbi:MAG: hypothetical protein JSV05_09725 [Candidatus Bathyarchaeota archaeon]|nr:MAG: hypothetical protein JSV05_09725 [Candidatus Bathyarchaeota archaeon]
MKLPCEVAVKSVVPAIRACLAKELIESYGLKQREAANLLGITQTAISKYSHHVRGSILPIAREKAIKVQIEKMAALLVSHESNVMALAFQICLTCRLVREKRLMCELCKQSNSKLDMEQCNFCSPPCTPTNEPILKEHTEQE